MEVLAQFVQIEGEDQWRIRLLFSAGQDMLSEKKFDTLEEANSELQGILAENGLKRATFH